MSSKKSQTQWALEDAAYNDLVRHAPWDMSPEDCAAPWMYAVEKLSELGWLSAPDVQETPNVRRLRNDLVFDEDLYDEL